MNISQFQPLGIEEGQKYIDLYAKNPEHTSDSSFTNLLAWTQFYDLKAHFTPHNCFIYKAKLCSSFWLPAGSYDTIDWQDLYNLTKGSCFERVPMSFAQALEKNFNGQVEIIESREYFDYIYSKEELVSLSGNKFHRKKNHLNGYIKAYGVDYRKFSDEVIDDVLALQEEWCKWRDCEHSPSLMAENDAILKILLNYNKIINLIGGALYVDNKIVAYTIAEALDQDNLLIHFEKGHNDFRGVYQAINQIFLQNEASGFRLINREQDMGEEGLRQAKESYYPIDFIKKYKVKIL